MDNHSSIYNKQNGFVFGGLVIGMLSGCLYNYCRKTSIKKKCALDGDTNKRLIKETFSVGSAVTRHSNALVIFVAGLIIPDFRSIGILMTSVLIGNNIVMK